jgi:hypothetical protein
MIKESIKDPIITIKAGTAINIQKINVFRFPQCMELHKIVLLDRGICCLGRFGLSGNNRKIANQNGYIFFYQHGDLFLAHISKVARTADDKYYPSIYKEYFFDKGLYPYEYLYLDLIEKVDSSILKAFSYRTKKRKVCESIARCNAAFLTCIADEDIGIKPE